MDRWLIAAIVVAAVLAAWWGSRWLRETQRAPRRVDLDDFGLERVPGNAVVIFTSPYCLACGAWMEALDQAGTPYVRVDVKAQADLARRYGVRVTPLVLAVRRDSGEVAAAYDSEPAGGDVSHLSALAAA